MDLPIHVPTKEVYRYMGYPEKCQDIPTAIGHMVEEEIAAAMPLLLPKATYLTCGYDKNKHCVLTPDGRLNIIGTKIQNHLAKCTKVSIFTCTIGSSIESLIDAYFKDGEYTRAIIVDAIGSAAVEYVADTLNQYLHTAAYRQKHHLVSRFSPGYGDWDLAIQKDLVSAAGGQAIDIQVTASSLLIPRKSISGIIGWIKGFTQQQPKHVSPCLLCQIPRCDNPICKGGQIS
jgi:hypothetical protein